MCCVDYNLRYVGTTSQLVEYNSHYEDQGVNIHIVKHNVEVYALKLIFLII